MMWVFRWLSRGIWTILSQFLQSLFLLNPLLLSIMNFFFRANFVVRDYLHWIWFFRSIACLILVYSTFSRYLFDRSCGSHFIAFLFATRFFFCQIFFIYSENIFLKCFMEQGQVSFLIYLVFATNPFDTSSGSLSFMFLFCVLRLPDHLCYVNNN